MLLFQKINPIFAVLKIINVKQNTVDFTRYRDFTGLKNQNKMKGLLAVFAVLVVVISACGPSAEELEANRVADSTRVADSLTQIAYNDSLEQAAADADASAAAANAAAAAAANNAGGDDGDDGSVEEDDKSRGGGNSDAPATEEEKEEKVEQSKKRG